MSRLHPRRLLLLTVGMLIMALGIALSIRSGLGTTTISSLPYVLSLITPMTLGTATILVNLGLVTLQVAILRRRFRLFQLLQLPILVIFGLFNDLALWATDWISHDAYWQQWLLVLAGIGLLGVGICFQIAADTVMLPGEATVLTISRELSRRFGDRTLFVFGYIKIMLDLTLVSSALILALTFLGGFIGVREGTLAAAFLIGATVKRLQPHLGPVLVRFRG